MQDTQMQELIDSVMLAGKIMIESGADMARVDDTLKRIARNGGIKEPKIFETTTGIMMSGSIFFNIANGVLMTNLGFNEAAVAFMILHVLFN